MQVHICVQPYAYGSHSLTGYAMSGVAQLVLMIGIVWGHWCVYSKSLSLGSYQRPYIREMIYSTLNL